MKMILIHIVNIALIVGLSSLSISCSKDDSDGTGSAPSVGDGDGENPIDDVPIGEIEQTGFWINLDTGGQFDVYLHKTGMYGSDCFVPTTGGDALTECTLDILEGDLYLFELPIQLNAPPGLCDAVSWAPAWHWNESSGYGPQVVIVEDDRTGGQDPEFASCTAFDDFGTPDTCSNHPELIDETNLSGPTCVYNRTSAGGENCCFGDYTFVANQDLDEDGTGDTLVTEERSWGGDPAQCLSPDLQRSWTSFTAAGYPAGLIRPVPKDENDETVGFNDEVFSLQSNASGSLLRFSTWANYYTKTGNPHSHDGYVSAATSNLPYAVEPIDDLDGSPVASGREYYRFRCLDGGSEAKHEIRLYIREWNTLSEFLAYGTSEGVSGNPDIDGVEGIGCDYDPAFGFACNDYRDLDDVLDDAGGSYPTNPADPTPAATRRSFFPNELYD